MAKRDSLKLPALIIGGGVGPMAGVELHRRIIEQTRTEGADQDHFDLIHLSLASRVNDRTRYLLEGTGTNPGHQMAEIVEIGIRGLESDRGGAEPYAVVGVPCNTFHAPPIFDLFLERMGAFNQGITVVHMLRETLELIHSLQPGAQTIGLMSTTGTRRSRVWHALLETEGYTVLEVDEAEQTSLHETIYHPVWGLKAVSPATETARDRFEIYAEKLIARGAEALVLGCTEIPLALPGIHFGGVVLIDPMLALARGMIKAAGPEKLQPLDPPRRDLTPDAQALKDQLSKETTSD